jgi:LmbE family N-acetylglucosaminyl deacetylase
MNAKHRRPSLKSPFYALALLSLLLGAASWAGNQEGIPLPEDRGTAGALASLQKLPAYARVLHIIAHPDDESSATLVWLAREAHVRTALFSYTRGEGGQNVLGAEKYEALGLLRTAELLEACRIYGAELYFGSEYDFGFSKTAEETLSKWGREETLEEIVRFVRTWRPTIIISKWQGNAGDGHGHHQAAGIISNEAFRAAGDPQRFPQHLKQGLRPWQAKKLYDNRIPGGAGDAAQSGWTVRLPVGDYDPVLGRSCREIGTEGYSRHRTQGNAAAFSQPGQAYDFYKLVDSTVGMKPREDGFFDAIETSLPAILELAGPERQNIPLFRDSLLAAQRAAEAALSKFDPRNPGRSAADAAKGAAILSDLVRRVDAASVSEGTKEILRDALQEKLKDFQDALTQLLGIYVVARSSEATGVPGQKLSVTDAFFNRGQEPVGLRQAALGRPDGRWDLSRDPGLPGTLGGGMNSSFKFEIEIPSNAAVTEPFFYLEDRRAARYKLRPTENPFASFGPPPFRARTTYHFAGADGAVEEPAKAPVADPMRGMSFPEFQIVPALSVSMTPELVIAPISDKVRTRELRVAVLNNNTSGARGTVKIAAPSGWQVEPAEAQFALSRKGERFDSRFQVRMPAGLPNGAHTVEAVVTSDGTEYRRGYRVVTDHKSWVRYLYSPSRSQFLIFDLKIAPSLTVGYVTGAGDEVPAVLAQLGVRVEALSGEALAFGDLSRYSAIVTGIRAYNVNEDLQSHPQRLLDYVKNGGTLIVQYNQPLGRAGGRGAGVPFPYGPYPMSISATDRITVEESAITIVAPQNPVFTTPNRITNSDFDGWVQERGLYFMSEWDSRYTPLLSGSDPGEKPLQGGMLFTRFGKGYYIYTAYAWFRQLPAGVPGAYRVFANMLSLAPIEGASER